MKLKYLFLFSAAAVFTAACSKETQFESHGSDNVVTLKVTSADVPVKNGHDASGKFYWSSKDRLGVFTDEGVNASLNLVSGAGTSTAEFRGKVSGHVSDYAVYPYHTGHKINGHSLTYSFPDKYDYTTVDTDFFAKIDGSANSFNSPMFGVIQENTVSMKYLGGVVCVKLDKLPKGDDLSVELSADQQICGEYTVDLNSSVPVIQAVLTENNVEDKVVISYANKADQSGVFYFPLPCGQYSNVEISFKAGQTEYLKASAQQMELTRAELKKIVLELPDPVTDVVLNTPAQDYSGELLYDHKDETAVTFKWTSTPEAACKILFSSTPDMAAVEEVAVGKVQERTFSHAELDAVYGKLGIRDYKQGKIYWCVEASNSVSSLRSDVRSLTMFRMLKPFVDPRDNEEYNVCRIELGDGTHAVWLAENYRSSLYPDGTQIETGQVRFFEGSAELKRVYGGYYGWNEAKKLAPEGWHLSTEKDWKDVIALTAANPGKHMKSKNYWSPAGVGLDTFGLNMPASGYIWEPVSANGVISTNVFALYWINDAAKAYNFDEGSGAGLWAYNENRGASVRFVQD